MLRNISSCGRTCSCSCLLNEVLSLNAQEFEQTVNGYVPPTIILNEVLSLNAQEYLMAELR